MPGFNIKVRVCDQCEVKMRVTTDDAIDVNDQINKSLKGALKEKAVELETFNALLLDGRHVVAALIVN